MGLSKRNLARFVLISSMAVLGACGAPGSFQKIPAGWKSIELRPQLVNDYDKAWQTVVDTVAREWDIEIMDKDSGYLRTAWTFGISGVTGSHMHRYRGRLTIKFPSVQAPLTTTDLKTEASWHERDAWTGIWYWEEGFDTGFNRDVYDALSGRLGRTAPSQ